MAIRSNGGQGDPRDVSRYLSEGNKRLREIKEEICCKVAALIDLTQTENNESQVILNEILVELQNLAGSTTGTSCATPTYTSLCELQQILDALNAIQIQINGDDIQINMNLDELEALSTTLNAIQTDALATLNSMLVELQRGASCGDPTYVSICNQLDITGLQATLNTIEGNTFDTVTQLISLQNQLTLPNTNHVVVDNLIDYETACGTYSSSTVPYLANGFGDAYVDFDGTGYSFDVLAPDKGASQLVAQLQPFSTTPITVSVTEVLGTPDNIVTVIINSSDLVFLSKLQLFSIFINTLGATNTAPFIQNNGTKALVTKICNQIDYTPLLTKGESCTNPIYIQDCVLENTLVSFQPKDCNDLDVGTPINALPVISVTKQIVAICNVQELADAINANTPTQYNNVKQYLLDAGNPTLTVPGGTVHSISYKVLSGTVDITIGADTLPYVKFEADMEEADGLIVQTYVFDATLGEIKIKVIY